ncbi:MAG: hypothetical protein RLZZ28_640, partial [Bacteroidota bacterium]
MLDFDLAVLYETETKVLNQAVKRNTDRFPEDFMFRLTEMEWQLMRSQLVTASAITESYSEVKLISNQHKRNSLTTPFVFTEQGVAMLSSVLHSQKAIQMNIAIMRVFIAIRKYLLEQTDLKVQLKELKERMGEHDAQLNSIYEAMENLLDEKQA